MLVKFSAWISDVIFFVPPKSCRINRILESPRGNALLVGVGGSGKQSLARLASYISSLEVFQITLRKGYGIPDLKVIVRGLSTITCSMSSDECRKKMRYQDAKCSSFVLAGLKRKNVSSFIEIYSNPFHIYSRLLLRSVAGLTSPCKPYTSQEV